MEAAKAEKPKPGGKSHKVDVSFFPIFTTDREGTPEQPSDNNNVVTYEGPPVTGSSATTKTEDGEKEEEENRGDVNQDDNQRGSEEGRLFVFGGHVGKYRGGENTGEHRNHLFVLHNAHTAFNPTCGGADPYWTKVTVSSIKDRAGHATFCKGEKLYIHAGYDSHHQVLTDMIEIDTATPNFTCKKLEYTKVVSNVERRWHSSHFFERENKFMIHGGWNQGGPLEDLLMLDLDEMAWSKVETTGEGASARRYHTMTQLPNKPHQFLCFGGYEGPRTALSDILLLNIETQQWMQEETKGDIPPGLCRHTMTALPAMPKQLFLIGGRQAAGSTCKEIRVLHTDDMSWTKVGDLGRLYPIIRTGHNATVVGDTGIVISGGFVGEYIEPFYHVDIRML